MARKPKPWFWNARGIWCVTLQGERHILGSDEAEAYRQFHLLMAGVSQRKHLETSTSGPLVAEVLDRFLDWCQKNRAPRTYDWYLGYIQKFLTFTSNADSLLVGDFKPFHVIDWVDSNEQCSGPRKLDSPIR